MDSLITNLLTRFKRADISIRFIYINTLLFLLYSVVAIVALLANKEWGGEIAHYLCLPSSPRLLLLRPWTLITYMFFHTGFWHILFNMLWLYWFGQLFLRLFSTRHFITLYLLGGIAGGLFYILAYNIFPYFKEIESVSYLLGASASVLAIVTATAVREPDYRVGLLFIGSVKLKYIAIFTILLSFLFIGSSNAGGNIAHLGGAFGGWLFAWLLGKGYDITAWMNGLYNFFSRPFKGVGRRRRPKMKAYRTDRTQEYDYNARKRDQEMEINRILEKLKRSGYSSLSDEEKKRLFDAGKR